MVRITVISVKSDLCKSEYGNRLQIEGIKGKGYFESRIFASEAEANVAKGLLMLLIEKYGENCEPYSEWDFLLRATLKLAYSIKTFAD